MGISINYYEIQKGDTLESIAGNLGISVDQLRRYHNTYCELSQLLGNDLKGHQNILIPSKKEIEKLAEENINITRNQALPYFISPHFYCNSYQVSQFIQKDKIEINLSYFVDIQCKEVRGGLIVSISRRDFYKNGVKVDDKISRISQECMASIPPIEVLISKRGQIQGIYNYQAQIKAFSNQKEVLKDRFIGEINHQYIDFFEQQIQQENIIMREWKRDFLHQVLLIKTEWFHQKEVWAEEFYIFSKKVKSSLSAIYKYDDDIMAEITGTLENLKGNITLLYTLDRVSQRLKNIEAEISFFDDENKIICCISISNK